MNKIIRTLLASSMALTSAQLAILSAFPQHALAAATGAGGKGGDSLGGGVGGAGGTGSSGAPGVAGATGAGGGGGAAGGGTGGNGGNDVGPGGAGGASGGVGTAGTGTGGGGGGGGGLNGQNGGALAAATGGAGGAGGAGTTTAGGGGGGAGGFGISGLTAGSSNTFTIVGGVGGAGGAAPDGGNGGVGGAAFSSATALTITNTGIVTGGAGGAGGAGTVLGGNGGDGGDAIAGSNLTIINSSGTITGGAAGAAGGGGGVAGTGGAAIAGSNMTITNAGTLSGGSTASAILFTGGTNSMTVQSGSIITGNVVAFSTADTFALGGTIDAAFDVSNIGPAAQYRGFGIFGKTGTSVWTLSGTTAFNGSTLISGGTLSLAGAASIANSSVVDNATFDISSTTSGTSIAGLTGSGLLALGTKTLTISNGSGTYSGSSSATSGGITISGGTTTFSGALSYTGATAISGGTLSLTGAGSIASSSGLTDNGAFDISQTTSGASLKSLNGSGIVSLGSKTLTLTAAADTFSGVFQDSGIGGGAGGGIAVSSGTEILSGANTYTGTTGIALGAAIQVGTGGGTGTLGSGAVTDNGMLIYNRSGSVTLAANVSGGGGVTQAGSGTLTITGTGVYTGATTVSSGTLQIGAGGTAGSVAGNIVDNAALVFNRSDTVTYAGIISGSGTLTKAGSGNLILTGINGFTGATNVSAGTLSVNGSLASSAITVASGGKLGGSGTVGPVLINSGGTLAPGNSIGTLTANGAVTFGPGSTYTVELSPTASDKLVVNGTATLAGTLMLVPAGGTYTAGTDYVLITATGVSGTFGTVTGAVSGFTNTIQYSANAVDLILSAAPAPATPPATPSATVINTFLFGTFGKTPNQVAAGNALAAGSFNGTLYVATGNVVKSNTATVPATLGQLAGDIHASIRSAAIEDSRIVRDTVLNRLDRLSPGVNLWGTLLGGYGSIATDGNATDLHHASNGAMVGIDMPVDENVRLGVAAAYTATNASTPGRLSTAKGGLATILGYGGYSQGAIDLKAGAAYSFGHQRLARTITALAYHESDSQSQHGAQGFATGGYKFTTGTAMVEPYLGIAAISATSGAFEESGDAGALSGAAKTNSQIYSTLGMKAAVNGLMLGDMAITPKIDLGWQHAFTRLRPGQVVAFQNAAQSFTVLGVPLAADAAALQLGFDLQVAPDVVVSAGYDSSFSGRAQNNALRIGLSLQP